MSYSIQISGHKDVADAEEGKAFEEKVARKARAFVASIEGVSVATGSFGNIGQQDLTRAYEPAPPTTLAEGQPTPAEPEATPEAGETV